MTALARAPCPRLWPTLRGKTTSSSPSKSSSPGKPASPPPQTHAGVDLRIMRCYMRYYATSSTSCWKTTAPLSQQQPQPQRRAFHGTRAVRADIAKRNHYERLQVSPTATPAEIKKSFYKLSKAHHPDANRHDPSAAHTFSLLSESYTLLSDPSRRAVYDRDVIRPLQQSQSSSPSHAPQHGSYHSSSTYAPGGRPPSGLSKRRGTFRGPPPSFYRSGGWGAHAEKRRKAHEESTSSSSNPRANSSAHYTNFEGHGASAGSSGNGAGDPFTSQQAPGGRFYRDDDDVPLHFDREGHRRTHENEDKRRWARRRRALDDEDVEFEPQTSLGAHFAIVLGILGATVLVPVMYLNNLSGKKKKNREY